MGSMEFARFLEGISQNSCVGTGSSALVLDCEKGELVAKPVKLKSDGIVKEKVVEAMKNHSEAERRRRARINGHLATLRGLIPGTNKMDKASLLTKVISHLKEMKKHAAEATRGLVIPFDTDEVRVEESKEVSDGAPLYIKASVCCDYRSEVLSDLRQSLDALHLKTIKAEVATLGGRMRTVFVVTGRRDENMKDSGVSKCHSASVEESLRSVLDRYSALQELSSRDIFPSKRRRVSCAGYPAADSSIDYCSSRTLCVQVLRMITSGVVCSYNSFSESFVSFPSPSSFFFLLSCDLTA